MEIKKYIGGFIQSNGYIIYRKDCTEAFIIDPGYKPERFLDFAADNNLEISGVLLTHHHKDHIGAVKTIIDKLGCTAFIHEADAHYCSFPVTTFEDGHVGIDRVKYEELAGGGGRSSAEMKRDVEKARTVQLERYENEEIFFNSQLTPGMIGHYCPLSGKEKKFMAEAYEKLALNMRGYYKVIKTARTIADLDGDKDIGCSHLAEAMRYRPQEQEEKWK